MAGTIPALILAMLGNPSPAVVQTQIMAEENVICWSTPCEALCFNYRDEGTHLEVTIGEE